MTDRTLLDPPDRVHLNHAWQVRILEAPEILTGSDLSWSLEPDPAPPADMDRAFSHGGAWFRADIPHGLAEVPADNFDEGIFHVVSAWRLRFRLDAAQVADARKTGAVLGFGGVMCAAWVRLNGVMLGCSLGGYTPFSFPAGDCLEEGNLLEVLVDSRELPGVPPFGGAVDYLGYAGIYREVWLDTRGGWWTRTLLCRTRDCQLGQVPVLDMEAAGAPGMWEPGDTVRLSLRPWEGIPAARDADASPPIQWEEALDSEGCLRSTRPLPGLRRWTLEDPALYLLEARLVRDGRDTGLVSRQRLGIREARFHPDGFRLNGERISLRGLNRHQSWPFAGHAMPRRAQEEDAENLRFHLGVTMVRQSHYPQSVHFLDRCDEIGLLVFAEMPGWQHVGHGVWKQRALDALEAMILRDRHHPSVAIWGVRINESPDDDDFYGCTNALARSLDPSRQTGGVRNFARSRFLEDVYTYNDFSHDGNSPGLTAPRKVAPATAPYLVTEHNGHMFPVKKTDPGPRRTTQALRHARALDAAGRTRRIAGALGWCMADYHTHRDFGSGDHICHHGVQDMYRLDKTAAWFYASQADSPPVGFVADSMNGGDHDGAFIADIPVFTNSPEVRVFRQDVPVGTFRPDRRRWPGLAHPPVMVDDRIGDLLETREGLCPSHARKVKAFLLQFNRTRKVRGPALPGMAWVMVRRGWTYSHVYALVARMLGGWGQETVTWRFEGWRGNVREWVQYRGPSSVDRLELEVAEPRIEDGVTWDCCRVVARLLDRNGNPQEYGSPPAELEVRGPLATIGPALRPLHGGSTAWWIRTDPGTGSVPGSPRPGGAGYRGTSPAAVRARCGTMVTEWVYIALGRSL